MLYTPATKKAMKLCFAAHKDQVDKSGVPYVFHPFHLAEQMQDEQTTVAAAEHLRHVDTLGRSVHQMFALTVSAI